MGPLRHGLRRLTFDRFGAFGRRVLRTDNASLPHLQNKAIYGRVESRNEDGFYTVDIGFKAPSMFHEKELKRGIGTKLKEERLPEIGERLDLYVRYLQNPMGEMEVSGPLNLTEGTAELAVAIQDVDQSVINLLGQSQELTFQPSQKPQISFHFQ